MMKKIKCIKCEAGKNAVVTELNDDLKSLQEAVGGYIEFVYPFPDGTCVLCNEEGKLEGLDFSRPLIDDDGRIYDIIAGTCYIMGTSCNGDNISLTEEQIEHFLKLWYYPIEVFRYVIDGRSVIDIRPYDEFTGRKVKAYGR